MKKLLTLLVCVFYATTSYSDITQENVSGGNTSIQGGYTTSTTYESGSSSAKFYI